LWDAKQYDMILPDETEEKIKRMDTNAMKDESKKAISMIAIGFAVMTALSLSYRIWLNSQPQQANTLRTMAEFIAKTAEEHAERLLRTPPQKWTDSDKKSEPRIFSWLEAHSKTILPWEWTEEAKKKDPSEYRKLWLGLFKEQKKELKTRLKLEREKIDSIDKELEMAKTTFAHRTNQIERIKAYVSSNSFPMSVKVERLSKGRFWGWNKDVKDVKLESFEDFGGEGKGWLTSETNAVQEEASAIIEKGASRKTFEERLAVIEDLLSRIAAIEDADEPNDGICLSEMCHLLRTGD